MKLILLADLDLGILVSLVGYMVVLIALGFLVGVFILIPIILKWANQTNNKRQQKKYCKENVCPDITGLEMAAISSAVYLYFISSHDEESNTITIKRVSKNYSPWSSKIYSMNKYSKS